LLTRDADRMQCLRSRYDGNFIVHERNPSVTFATDISRGKYEETLVMNSEEPVNSGSKIGSPQTVGLAESVQILTVVLRGSKWHTIFTFAKMRKQRQRAN
jgi:hypothetical protein